MDKSVDKPESKNGDYFKEVVSIGLGLALTLSLLPKNHRRVKFDISEILIAIWLAYSIYYKDYPVMAICIIILTYSLIQKPQDQVMAWS